MDRCKEGRGGRSLDGWARARRHKRRSVVTQLKLPLQIRRHKAIVELRVLRQAGGQVDLCVAVIELQVSASNQVIIELA